MVFNDRVLFLHIGKTGGMSCSEFLLRFLERPVWNCHGEASAELQRLQLTDVDAAMGINRHCTLAAASRFLEANFQRQLSSFEKIIAVFRHPYSLEYSWYQHLRKPLIRARRQDDERLLKLAEGDFESFVRNADHHRPGLTQEKYVLLEDTIPANVDIIRFESLSEDFPRAVAKFLDKRKYSFASGSSLFPKINSTHYDKDLEQVLTQPIRAAIRAKHAYLFTTGFYDP
ncbi:MAG: hypothetical protein AAF098_02055 [Pseudomonadota bacterium]